MKSHDDLKQWYLDTLTHTQDNRALCERDRDYKDNKQWTQEEEHELKKRKQPVITVNRIKPKIDAIIGMEVRSRTDIKAFPRTPNDEGGAEAATDSLRYIADNKDFDQIKTECAENLFVEGTCAGIVEVEKTKRGFEVCPRVIPWDRFFVDPHSVKRDGSDALFMGQAIWLESDVAKEMFPGKEDLLDAKSIEEGAGDTYDDKPKHSFYDQTRDRVKILEVYFYSKGWKHCVFTGQGYLIDPRPSPYLDEDGDPTNPIVMQSAFIDRDNNRYGSVRQMISIQDEINKRRSKSLHLLNNRQTVGEEGAVKNVNQMKREMAKPDGHVEVRPGLRFERMDNSDLAAGQLNLLQEAKNEIDQIGANASVTGKEERSMSGRAMQVRQQQGTVELTPVLDGLRHWEKRMYRQMWMRVKQYWTEEKWIRVTDDEKNLKFVGLNKPVTMGEQLQKIAQESDNPAERENAQAVLQELVRNQDPRLNQVAEIENPVTELDVDIVLEAVPDMVNIEAEQFELLAGMYQANPQAIPFEMIIESSSLRNKERILEKLKGTTPEEQQARQMQQEIAQQSAVSEIEKTKSETAENLADAEHKRAETMRLMVSPIG